jgi:tripartite-type tricarboxylate transporter receptor subunit TctC
VDMIVIGLATILPALKTGKVRLLAITSQNRFPGLEEVPTAAETLPGFHAYAWLTLVAPTGTSAEIVQRANRETDQVLRQPEVVERLRTFGATTSGAGTPQSIAEFIHAERERWGKVIKDAGIKPQ